jgi:hypothetical protein
MSKVQPWLNFAKVYQDAEGNWVLNVLGRELFVRAYGGTMEGDTDEAVIVIGNRRTLEGFDEGTIEAEFVFPQSGVLLTAHVLKVTPEARFDDVPDYPDLGEEDTRLEDVSDL